MKYVFVCRQTRVSHRLFPSIVFLIVILLGVFWIGLSLTKIHEVVQQILGFLGIVFAFSAILGAYFLIQKFYAIDVVFNIENQVFTLAERYVPKSWVKPSEQTTSFCFDDVVNYRTRVRSINGKPSSRWIQFILSDETVHHIEQPIDNEDFKRFVDEFRAYWETKQATAT